MITYEEMLKKWNSSERAQKKSLEWLSKLENTKSKINSVRKSFHQWTPLKVYTSTTKGFVFSVRFYGQEVAELEKKKDSVVLRISSKNHKNNQKHFNCLLGPGEYPWKGIEARKFRKFFAELIPGKFTTWTKEHRVEELFLNGLTGKEKLPLFRHRTAIGLENIPLHFPVPFSARNGKINDTQGSIDILGRSKNGTHISVWEVKDVGQSKKVVEQAYIYALQILLLFRNCNLEKRWLKIFGLDESKTGKKKIEIVLAVSDDQKDSVEKQIKEALPEISRLKEGNSIFITGAYYSYDGRITDIKYIKY